MPLVRSKKVRIVGLVGSAILHLLVPLLFLPPKIPSSVPTGRSPLGMHGEVDPSKVIYLNTTSTDTKLVRDFSHEYRERPKAKSLSVCGQVTGEQKKDYRGIGIIDNPISGLVIQAPPQYPAYKAGIREGDRIIAFVHRGDYVHVVIERDGRIELSFKVRKERICLTEK